MGVAMQIAELPPAATAAQKALAVARERLRLAGVASPGLDARLLLADVLNAPPEHLLIRPENMLTDEQCAVLSRHLERRENGEPVSRIVGKREFWSMDFELSSDVLDPRPDSETLVESAVAFGKKKLAPSILDMGTGSGCLLLAVLAELPQATGTGVDISDGALAVAQRNVMRHGLSSRVRMVWDDWGSAVQGRFDIILCNPPYIPSQEIEMLAKEVAQFDPRGALDGGDDGLRCYRQLLPHIAQKLAAEGRAFVEVGMGQAKDVAALAAENGLRRVEVKKDLAGIERCLVLVRESKLSEEA